MLLVVGGLAVLAPFAIELNYRSPTARATLETIASFVALLVAYILLGRFRLRGQLRDLLLAASLLVSGVGNLAFAAVPSSFATLGDAGFATYGPMATRLLGAVLFAAAALAPSRTIADTRRAADRMVSLVIVFLTVLGVGATLAADRLPLGVDPALPPNHPSASPFDGIGVAHVAQGLRAVLFAIGATVFLRLAIRSGDALTAWIGAGGALSAAAGCAYFFQPSIVTDWVSLGDGLQLLSLGLYLAGAATEIRANQQAALEAAKLAERRRLAAEIHDGLAQDMFYLAVRAAQLAESTGLESLNELAEVADEALAESRYAVNALATPSDSPFDVSLANVARFASRGGLQVTCDIPPDAHVEGPVRTALERIVREAVTNAARHSKAEGVRVELELGDELRLRIVDDGIGFVPQEAARLNGHHFGLISMRERAEGLGGSLLLHSEPQHGTAVEVVLPWR